MNSTLKWLWQVPGRKKALIAALTAAQVLLGGCGVLYALLLRSIVNSAVAHEGAMFWHYVMLMILLVAGQLMLQALIRWLGELSTCRASVAFYNDKADIDRLVAGLEFVWSIFHGRQ